LCLDPHARQEVDAGDGEHERSRVSRRAGAERGQQDDRKELDRSHRAEREPVDRGRRS